MTPIDWRAWGGRPLGRAGTILIALAALLAPAWLFADALGRYRLFSDDFAYVSASRSPSRTLENLFRPHNTHIVPSWRVLTLTAVATAGRLADLPPVLARFTYAGLLLVLLAVGRLVARETGRASAGLAAMIAAGTTSVAWSSSTWYSSGQTLWAALGVLGMLNVLQTWRRKGGAWRLGLAVAWAWLAGGFWTIGHAAGPVGAIYLWADGRPTSRKAAAVPLLATAFAVIAALWLGGRQIEGKVSFHGRSTREALSVKQGILHTLQAIPENVVFGNLGLAPTTTESQAAGLCVAGLAVWGLGLAKGRRPSPLEWAGAALLTSSYLVEWSFRGYMDFTYLRGIVPWYDTIPHIGAVLLAACWWGGPKDGRLPIVVSPPSRAAGIVLLTFLIAWIGVHRARVDLLTERNVPTFHPEEFPALRSPGERRSKALGMADLLVLKQHRDLERLDRIQAIARRAGFGREAIRRAIGRVEVSELPEVYDPIEMLDLPSSGGEEQPDRVKSALRDELKK